MARIPKFTRTQLASEVVGTPGVDTGAGAGFALAAGISDAANELAVARRTALETTEANKQSIQLGIDLERARIDHQAEFQNDPINSTAKFQNKANQIVNDRLETITSSRVRNAVAQNARTRIGNKAIELTKWESDRQVKLGFENIMQSADGLAIEAGLAGQTGDFLKFSELLREADSIQLAGSTILSASQQKEFEAINKSLATSFALSLAESNPDELIEAVNSGRFGNLFDAKESKKLKDTAKDIKIKQNKEIKLAEAKRITRNELEVAVAMSKGEVTLTRLQELATAGEITEASFIRGEKRLTSSNSQNAAVKDRNEVIWGRKIFELEIQEDGKSPQSAETIAKTLAELQEVAIAGGFDEGDEKRLIDTFQKALGSAVQEEAIEETAKGKFRWPWQSLEDWAENNADDVNTTSARMMREYLSKFDPLQDNGPQVVQEIIKQEQERKSPQSIGKEIGDMVQTTLGPRAIKGFTEAGKIIPDLSEADIKELQRRGVKPSGG